MTWQRFFRTGSVTASRLGRPLVWPTGGGNELVGQPGDWHVEDGDGKWTVANDAFTAGYKPGDGVYRRRGTVRARRGFLGEVVQTQEGEVGVVIGDWVVEGPGGERWVVPAARFARTYMPVTSRSPRTAT